MKNLTTINDLIRETENKLLLSQINPEVGSEAELTSSALNIPGLELTGFWEDFPNHKLQVFSKKEIAALLTKLFWSLGSSLPLQ